LNQRQGPVSKQVRFFNTDRVIFVVLVNAIVRVVDCHIELLEIADHLLKNFQKLRLLFFQEVNFGELDQLESLNETSVLDVTHAHESLDFEGGCEFNALLLLAFVVGIPILEYETASFTPLNLFICQKQILIVCHFQESS
jgi:hypothetical protein